MTNTDAPAYAAQIKKLAKLTGRSFTDVKADGLTAGEADAAIKAAS